MDQETFQQMTFRALLAACEAVDVEAQQDNSHGDTETVRVWYDNGLIVSHRTDGTPYAVQLAGTTCMTQAPDDTLPPFDLAAACAAQQYEPNPSAPVAATTPQFWCVKCQQFCEPATVQWSPRGAELRVHVRCGTKITMKLPKGGEGIPTPHPGGPHDLAGLQARMALLLPLEQLALDLHTYRSEHAAQLQPQDQAVLSHLLQSVAILHATISERPSPAGSRGCNSLESPCPGAGPPAPPYEREKG